MPTTSLQLKTLPYQPDAILHYFAPLSWQPWAMLLHSGSAEHAHNRFDILVADPLITLTTCGQQTEIVSAAGTQCSEDDPFQLLQQQLDTLDLPPTPRPDIPFQGGRWGFLVTILAAASNHYRHRRKKISICPIWPLASIIGH